MFEQKKSQKMEDGSFKKSYIEWWLSLTLKPANIAQCSLQKYHLFQCHAALE